MEPPSPQTTLKEHYVAKDDMARLQCDENRELQDISNFTRNFRNNINNEEILSPERKKYKMQATSSKKDYEYVLNKDSENEDEEYVNVPISILKSILSEIKELKKGHEKIFEAINQLGNAKSSSTAVIKEVQKLNLPLQTVEQFHSLMNDEKALAILEKYFVLLGGFNMSNALDGFLRASVTDKLIKTSFTWKEGDKKIRFRETALSLKYYGALRKIENFKNTSVKDYELEMSKVIKNAQQRHYMSQHRKEHENVNALEKSRAENLLAAKYATASMN